MVLSMTNLKQQYGEMLQKKASEYFPEIVNKHLETVMRYMRKYRREECVCVDRYNSIYEKRAKHTEYMEA